MPIKHLCCPEWARCAKPGWLWLSDVDGAFDTTVLTFHLPAQTQADKAKAAEIQPRTMANVFDTWVIKPWKSTPKALVDSLPL